MSVSNSGSERDYRWGEVVRTNSGRPQGHAAINDMFDRLPILILRSINNTILRYFLHSSIQDRIYITASEFFLVTFVGTLEFETRDRIARW